RKTLFFPRVRGGQSIAPGATSASSVRRVGRKNSMTWATGAASASGRSPRFADDFLKGYRLRNPKSATFAEYAVGHVKRLAGSIMAIDLTDAAVRDYQ